MAISERTVCPEPVPDRLNRLSRMGVPAVQIRDKSLEDRKRFEWIRQRENQETLWLVNGRADLALLGGLDGIHRSSSGVPLEDLVKIGGDDLLYGQSTHSLQDVRRAFKRGADYVLFGPVYPTPSKPNLAREDLPGLKGLDRVTDQVDGPVLALGGIRPDRIPACRDAGAYGVAGIRVLFEPDDPRKNWHRIRNHLSNGD
jgi:thiamine-phosphate pyrophosphorylase